MTPMTRLLGMAFALVPTTAFAAPICVDAGTWTLPPAIVTISAGRASLVVLRTNHSTTVNVGEDIEVAGNTVRVTLTTSMHGFIPTSQLNCTVSVPTLSRGNYTLEYYLSINGFPPTLVEAKAFSVADDASAIPTLEWPFLLTLIGLIVFATREALARRGP